MALVPLKIPPGIYRNGTRLQARGRWRDGNLVRWHNGVMQPVGGWSKIEASGADIDLGEPVVSAFSWRDNDDVAWLALGTPTKCWVYAEGALTDITPTSFTTGAADASTSTGVYGAGVYGAGPYGEGGAPDETIVEAQTWQFDNFGEFLIAQAYSDGKLYYWQPNSMMTELTVVDAGAPENNIGVVVTPERFLVALGADNDPRTVQWADQETLDTWTPTTENQAGDFPLTSAASILAAQRARGETLIWTAQDLHTMQYIGGTLVYTFAQIGSNCGMISRRAYAMVDGSRALWMGHNSFFIYDGNTRPLPSDVNDHVFSDLNRLQASKIHAVTMPQFNEVWWFYPSSASTDVDRYVSVNYLEGHWSVGDLARTAAVSRGVFRRPIMADANGAVYHHETGASRTAIDGATEHVPFAVTAPVQIGNGDQVAFVRNMIPDENTLGDTSAWLRLRQYPTDAGRLVGPFNPAGLTNMRASGREVQLRVAAVTVGNLVTNDGEVLTDEDGEPLVWSSLTNDDWRFGQPRLDIVPGEQR